MYSYSTKGVCSRQINFDIEDNKLKNISFVGGCEGNLSGISKLVDGMDVNDVIAKLKGTTCGPRSTSCPDQLALAIEQAMNDK